MTLGKKTVALFLVLGLSFTIGSFATLRLSVLPAFSSFEREASRAAFARVSQLISADLREIGILNREYSEWDDTHAYALGNLAGYEELNFDQSYWQGLNVQLLLAFDRQGKKLYGRLWRHDDSGDLSLREIMHEPLFPTHPLASNANRDDSVSGLLMTREGLMQVVSLPIMKSLDDDPVAGSLVIGRFLTDTRTKEIGARAAAEVSIYTANSDTVPPRAAAAVQELLTSGNTRRLETAAEAVSEYMQLTDIFGTPVAVLEVRTPRNVTKIGSSTVQTATLLLGAASAIFLISAWLFIQILIVRPVKTLTEQMLGIRRTGNLQVEVVARRSDEVGVLAGEFGALAAKLGIAQQELETARDEAVAMSKTKSEFLARMSHEIRTPMNGVLGMTELLQNTTLDNQQQRFTHTIYESAESLLAIINDILDFSKMEAGKLRLDSVDVDLHNILDETIDTLANLAFGKGIELICMPPEQLEVSVQTDPGRLRQVLTNLVGNAIKFTEEGEVVLRVTATEVDAENLDVAFEISDTGIGITATKQKVIFNSFTQEDGSTTRLYGGTGLGLAISKQLIDLMNGDLAVVSTPGTGSTFSFTLRMKKGCASEVSAATQAQFVAGTKVLVVDDNTTNLEILKHQLRSWRATTDCAETASDALRILEAAVAAGEPHDLAILDMHMPHTDGVELARAIRNNPDLAELRLIILSSVATPASDRILEELTIAGQLSKPIRQSRLYNSLVTVLGGKPVAQTHSNLKVAATKALSGHVLLAEDNPVNQAVATGMLEAMGLTVTVASNGRQAIEQCGARRFDAILMDCQMPDMDGFEATKAVRIMETGAGKRPAPIVAVTANALKGDREVCLAAGMDDYLTKPFTSEQLHAVLTLYLRPAGDAQPVNVEPKLSDERRSATAASGESPLDRNVLDVLARLQQPGAPSLLHNVINAYLESSGELHGKLRLAIESADSESVRESAHALKSSSANVGAIGLSDIAKRLEFMGRENNLADAAGVHRQFEQEYAHVVAALKLEAESIAA